MAMSPTGATLYLVPGDKVKIKVPVKPELGSGFFAAEGPIVFNGEPNQVLLRGFIVENTSVGTIEVTDVSEAAVIYTHKKAHENSIWFFALTGETGICTISSMHIHDHSSLVQGGPAHGVYFSDYGEEEEV